MAKVIEVEIKETQHSMPQSISFSTLGQSMTKVGQKGLDTASQTISVSRSGNQRTNGLTQISQSRTADSQLRAVKTIASATIKMDITNTISQSVSLPDNRPNGGLIVNSLR